MPFSCKKKILSAKLDDLRQYYSDFPWDNYCIYVKDPSLFAEHGVIHSSYFNTKAKKPWINSACSRAVKDREVVHKRYRSNPYAQIHALYIYARNHAKSIFQLSKSSFINRKCHNVSHSTSSRDFWHIANNICINFTSLSFIFTSIRWFHSCLFFL